MQHNQHHSFEAKMLWQEEESWELPERGYTWFKWAAKLIEPASFSLLLCFNSTKATQETGGLLAVANHGDEDMLHSSVLTKFSFLYTHTHTLTNVK